MKKLFALLLATLLCVSLCACGEDDLVNDRSAKEEEFVGTWVLEYDGYYYQDIYSMRLLANGKAIWTTGSSGESNVLVTRTSSAHSGEWMVDEDRIIIFYDNYDGDSWAHILQIADDGNLKQDDRVYTKRK